MTKYPRKSATLSFDEAYYRLKKNLQDAFDNWCNYAKELNGGMDIVENTKEEKQLKIDLFFEFLESIANSFLEQQHEDPNNIDAKLIYESVCKNDYFHFEGNSSKINYNTVLHNIVNVEDLKVIIHDVMAYASVNIEELDSVEEAWTDFWDDNISNEERMEYLADVGLYYPKYIIWAYFNLRKAERGTAVDPLEGKSADDCCNILGMPPDWSKYSYGQNLYKIQYTLKRSSQRYIPTIADACASGWNPYFQPAPEKKQDAKWGRTRPIGKPRGQKGMPEIIHKGGKSPARRADFYSLPEDLGER